MENTEFVRAVRKEVIDKSIENYRNWLENTVEATDEVWKSILPIYKGLDSEQRKAFLDFTRLVQVNSVSHIFGILDGTSFLNEDNETFILRTARNPAQINGDLQDIFLEIEE